MMVLLQLFLATIFVFGFAAGWHAKTTIYTRTTTNKIFITPAGFSTSHKYHTNKKCSSLSRSGELPSFEQCHICRSMTQLKDE